MEFVIAMILVAGSFIAGIIGNLVASEIYAHSRRLANWVVRGAAARIPESERSRYVEEWRSHLDECDGNLTGLWHAFGCLYCAKKLAPKEPFLKKPREKIAVLLLSSGLRFGEANLKRIEGLYDNRTDSSLLDEIRNVRDQIGQARLMFRTGHTSEGVRIYDQISQKMDYLINWIR
jgi:hypothetical protein